MVGELITEASLAEPLGSGKNHVSSIDPQGSPKNDPQVCVCVYIYMFFATLFNHLKSFYLFVSRNTGSSLK